MHRNSKTYRMVEWLYQQGERGATMNEVATAFGMDPDHAHGLLGVIARRHYCQVILDDSVSPRRYVVQWVDKAPRRNGIARPIIGTHPKGMVVKYRSIAAAQSEGGFCSRGIQYALGGRQRTHAGYRWSYQDDMPQEVQ